jgi:hypothetical protein
MGKYSNWESQSNYYRDNSEIKKRTKFDIDTMSENLLMIQNLAALKTTSDRKKEEKAKILDFAKNIEGYNFGLEEGEDYFSPFKKDLKPVITGTRKNKEGDTEGFSLSYEEMDAARLFILGGTDPKVIFDKIKANPKQLKYPQLYTEDNQSDVGTALNKLHKSDLIRAYKDKHQSRIDNLPGIEDSDWAIGKDNQIDFQATRQRYYARTKGNKKTITKTVSPATVVDNNDNTNATIGKEYIVDQYFGGTNATFDMLNEDQWQDLSEKIDEGVFKSKEDMRRWMKSNNLKGLFGEDLTYKYDGKVYDTQSVSLSDAKKMAKFSTLSLIHKLPRDKNGKLVDTEITRRKDGTLVKVNAIEKDLYDNHPRGQEIVDKIAGLPKKDKDGKKSQQTTPGSWTDFNWDAGGDSLKGGQGSGGGFMDLATTAAFAVNPLLGVGLMAADWMYGSAQKAKGVKKQIGKLEDGIDVLANSQQQAIEGVGADAQNALDNATTALNTTTEASSMAFENAESAINKVNRSTKGLEVGATNTVLADASEIIATNVKEQNKKTNVAVTSEIETLGKSGRDEIESIGYEIASVEDELKTLRGQDSMVEQMFGSNIGGTMEKWG